MEESDDLYSSIELLMYKSATQRKFNSSNQAGKII